MFAVEVYVSLKKGVADPQGLTVKHGLESLGFKDLKEVRMGKFITLNLEAKDKVEAETKVREMCEKLLINPIIEAYRFKLEEVR
jgi:phosphoribosylformylglycinamidine synthase